MVGDDPGRNKKIWKLKYFKEENFIEEVKCKRGLEIYRIWMSLDRKIWGIKLQTKYFGGGQLK